MFRVFRGGCGSAHAYPFVMTKPEGFSSYILLITRTQGDFNINENHYHVTSGNAIIISPGTPYSYSNPNGEYVDDWLHFSVESENAFHKLFPHLNQPLYIGETDNYTALIHQILWDLLYSPQPYSDQNIDSLFGILINRLSLQKLGLDYYLTITPYTSKLQSLRLEIQNNITNVLDISHYARSMGISESYFQHLYTELFGVSFQRDIISLRIEHAKNILLTTNLTIEQIAELCGYNNLVHFYRQFKKVAGITPAKYRKLYIKSP